MMQALGFLEVRGLVAGIECADAMLKAANVHLATQITTNPALITLIVEGDIGSCRAAIDAGRLAAERQGAMVSEKVIGRPESDLALFLNVKQRWSNPPSQAVHTDAVVSSEVAATSADSSKSTATLQVPTQSDVSAASSAHAVADLGSDPNSAYIAPMEAQPIPELGSAPNSADLPDDASPGLPGLENANLQPASTALVTDPLETLISYLTSTPNGKRLDQLAASMNLPEADLETLLNFAQEQGRLKKAGSRYLIP